MMLRRSTGLPEEMKRVGVSSEMKCVSGDVKRRCVARARFSAVLSESESEADVVGSGGSSEAMAWRREVSGSCTVAIFT